MISSQKLFEKGDLINSRYEVEELLGAGGMGWVLRVRDRQFERQSVALKLLYPHLLSTEASFARFRNEVCVTRRLSHPAIVQTFGFGRDDDGLPYVAMEYVQGQTLKGRIQDSPVGLHIDELERILIQIVEGLRFAHSRGIVHRDIKPENILMRQDGIVKIADFGLAQMFRQESHLTRTGDVVGTPFYMSPEQVLGEPLTRKSDVYSFGVLCYEMASGSPPFSGESLYDIAEKHLLQPFPRLSHRRHTCPDWLSELIAGSTEKKPSDRFSSMDEISLLLKSHLSDKTQAFFSAIPSSSGSDTAQIAPRRILTRSRQRVYATLIVFTLVFLPILSRSLQSAAVMQQLARQIFFLEKKLDTDLKLLKWVFSVQGTYGNPSDLYVESHKVETRIPLELVRVGMDPNTKNPKETEKGDYLVHRWTRRSASNERWIRKFDNLIDYGVDLNKKNGSGQTAVQIAYEKNLYKTLSHLLLRGADPDITDPEGLTPLARAVFDRKNRYIQLLLLHRASPNIPSPRGQTALHFAAINHDYKSIWYLLERGADPNLQDKRGKTALDVMLETDSISDRERLTDSEYLRALRLLADAMNPNLLNSAYRYALESKDQTTASTLEGYIKGRT